MIDLAGLLAAAALLATLVALEVRRAGPDTTGQPTRTRVLSPTVSRWAVAALWSMYLLLFLPRVLGLLV